ncbi:MAG TPA: tyrosine--tRNA ligase [Chloroflexota bacterium]|jgi:tyrosyl-tRNA synthetase|nr:tyrosine--tRNA ligase [Chloroflexota bacterium]
MRFRIQDAVFEQFPTYCIGLVVAEDIENASGAAEIELLLRDAERRLPERLDGRQLKEVSGLAVWHEAFRAAGISPGRFKPSVEALAARVLKGDILPQLNPAVDLVNALSLTYLLPIGAHDLDRLQGDLEVGPVRAQMPFTPLGSHETEVVEPGEYVYADAQEVRTRRWVWRQGDHSRVTERSHAIVFPIDGWIGVTDQAVRDAAADLRQMLAAAFGVQARLHFLDRDRREVVLRDAGALPDTVIAAADGFRMSGLGAREHLHDATPAEASHAGMSEASGGVSGAPAPVLPFPQMDAIDELLTRGTVEVIVRDVLEQRLRRGERLRVKLGVDPTGPHLHIGHAVELRKLRAFQQQGHTICLVVGDFTAQIGDASDRSAMRQMLSEEEIYAHLTTYKKQIARVLDPDLVEWSYNNDWLGPLRFKDVIGLAAHFTVAQMLERENFALRYAAGKPIGLQEFMYPLMQGYDSVALKADVEVGGTDQLFNLMAGRTLQQAFGQRPQVVMTCPLLLGTDGQKMSKTAGNCIYIDDKAKDMYGKVMSISDQQILPYFELCTDVPVMELQAIAVELRAGANPMLIKKQLAYEITRLYHGDAQARHAQEAFEHEVQRKELPDTLDERWLGANEPRTLPDLLLDLGLVASKSEARRLATQHGVRIDGEIVTEVATPLQLGDGSVVQVGKRKHARVRLRE